MRNVVLEGVRKILETYYIDRSHRLLQHNKFVALIVLQDDVKYLLYFKRNILKNLLPNTFQLTKRVHIFLPKCQKKPIAVKYVKNYESFEETSVMSVKENFMVCSTWGDFSYFICIKKIRIPKAKSTRIQFILSKKLQKYS